MLHRRYHTSDISLQNALGDWSVGVAETDTTDIVWESEAGPFDSVVVRLRQGDTLDIVPASGIYEVDTVGDLVITTVSGLDRGLIYELLVTVTYADETTASGTFIIECVA